MSEHIQGVTATPPGSREPSRAVSAASGFDPSRMAFLTREKGTKEAMAISFTHSIANVDTVLEVSKPYGRICEYSMIPREMVAEGEGWLQRTVDAAEHLPWVERPSFLALSDSAGPKDIAQDQRP